MIDRITLRELNKKGFFNRVTDAVATPTFTQTNIGMPAGILSSLNNQVVKNIVAYRTADKALGKREKLLDWADDNYFTPMVESTGQTVVYSDYSSPLLAGMNVNYNMVGHYRFTTKFHYGELEAQQLYKSKVNYEETLLNTITEAIGIELNRVAFNGFIQNSSNAFVCYGLLNNPELPNYEAAAKTFDAMTWEEVMAFFGKAIAKLTSQTGNNINGESKIRVVISSDKFAHLQSKYTALGISVYQTILNTYPNIEFVSAYEFNKAYNNQDIIYFIGESDAGGIAETTKLGYSELALMGNVVQDDYGYTQAISAGTCGALVFKPLFVVRYNNI